MSFKVQELVWTRYPGEGTELMLAVLLAWYAHDDGSSVYPSVETLGPLLRQRSRRTVQTYLARMRSRGFLSVVANASGGRGRATRYQINLDWLTAAPLAARFSAGKGRELAREIAESAQSRTESAQRDAGKSAAAPAPEQSLNLKEQSEQQQQAGNAVRPSSARRQIAQPLPPDFGIDEGLRAFAVAHDISGLEAKVEVFLRWAKKAAGVHDWDAAIRQALLSWSFNGPPQKQPKVNLDEVERRLRAGTGS